MNPLVSWVVMGLVVMRLTLTLLGIWFLACIAVVLVSVLWMAVEGRLEERRLHREIDRDLEWLLGGGIDVPLPPRRRRLRLRRP